MGSDEDEDEDEDDCTHSSGALPSMQWSLACSSVEMQSVDEHAMEPDWVSGEGPSCALALVLITFLGGRRGAVPGGRRGAVPGGRRGAVPGGRRGAVPGGLRGAGYAFKWARRTGGRRGAVPGGCVQGATVNATMCVRVAWGQVGWPLWPLRGPGVEGRRGEAPGARDRS